MRTSAAKCAGLALTATVALAGVTLPAQAAEWSDTWLGLRLGNKYREPANSQDISKTIVQLQHASGYSLGTNFVNVDVLKSDGKDPANGGGGGAQEVYMVYRNTLSFGKLTGKNLGSGFIRDYGFMAGFDLNSKDDQFASRVRKLIAGPSISFDVPGFWNVAVVYRKEKNHNGIVGANVTFDDTYGLSSAWGVQVPAVGAVFKGFFDYIGAKGKDGFGADTKPEILTEFALMFDVGRFAGKKETFYIGPGYQYWRNKFGSDSSKDKTGGSTAKVPQLQFEAHF